MLTKKIQNKNFKKRFILATVIIIVLSFILSGCQSIKDEISKETVKYEITSDFSGSTIGSQTGTVFDDILNSAISGLNHKYYDDITGQILALRNEEVDAVGLDEPVAKLVVSQNSDFEIFKQIIETDTYGFPMKKGSALTAEVSKVIDGFIEDGTIDALKEKWFSGDEEKMQIDMSEYTGYDTSGGVIKYVHDSTQTPMSYVDDNGNSAGYEVELILKIGKALSKKVEITQSNFSALITSVSSGKADIASGTISITDERRQSVDFPTSHYTGGIVLLCRKADVAIINNGNTDTQNLSFGQKIIDSFVKTFLKEYRWKLLLSGLLVTIIISILALIIGTILGFCICLLRRSENKTCSSITKFIIRFIQGIPVVVLLMILYYMVFVSSGISGVGVAIIGFSLNFGVNAAEIMRTGIDAVDNGQLEAATALAMNKRQTMYKIILPQAIRHFLPAYKGEFINMMKMTSVVGYIAVQDLTKASDIIRSRTYEAFFPLIVNALIYLLLAWGLTSLIGLIEIKLDYKKYRKTYPSAQKIAEHFSKKIFKKINTEEKQIISIENLTKEYNGHAIIKDVNASVNAGEVIAIIGPSGSGKTTFLRMINRLEKPSSGKTYIFGRDMDNSKDCLEMRKQVGMVFQKFNLFSHLSVIENVMLAPMTVLKVPKEEAYENALSLLNIVGLAQKAGSYPDEISGGQQQRVAIARALAMKPKILLLDEPTSALDPTMVSEVLSVIRALAKSGLTLMIVTHEMQFARDVSNRVFYLDQGEIYESGTPEQIFETPSKEKTRRFIYQSKVFEENITSHDFDFIGINTKIEEFGRKHIMPQKTINKLQRIFEELVVQTVLPTLSDEINISMVIEYSEETEQTKIFIKFNGELKEPTCEDELSMLIVREYTDSIEYVPHPDEELQNEIVVVCK